jgi:hypothetical protein
MSVATGTRFLPMAIVAHAEYFKCVGDFRVTHAARHVLQRLRHAKVNRFHPVADAADDMMMVRFATVKFITVGAVTKIAAPHQVDPLHRGQTAIHGDQVANSLRDSPMKLIGGKWPVFPRENGQNRTTRRRDAMPMTAQHGQRKIELSFVIPARHGSQRLAEGHGVSNRRAGDC